MHLHEACIVTSPICKKEPPLKLQFSSSMTLSRVNCNLSSTTSLQITKARDFFAIFLSKHWKFTQVSPIFACCSAES